MSSDITLDTFADDIVGTLESEELAEVVLVGHSFAGAPISLVAERLPGRLRHVVYLDAVMVKPGASVLDALAPADAADRIRLAEESGGVWVNPPDAAAFGLVDAQDLAWVNRRLTPHPFSTYKSALKLAGPLGNGLACTYVACMRPPRGEVDSNRAWVQSRSNFRWVEIAEGHDVMISNPALLADLLTQLSLRA